MKPLTKQEIENCRKTNKYVIPEGRNCQTGGITDIYMERLGYKTDGRYIEAGAFNGLSWTNSECFAIAGWHGLMVEPQAKYAEECRKNYANYPNVVVEQCAIGSRNGKIELLGGSSIATTDPEFIESWRKQCGDQSAKHFYGKKKVQVKLFTLDTLLEKKQWPDGSVDVIILDTEGSELDALKGITLERWRPTILVIECCEGNENFGTKTQEIENVLFPVGYEKVLRGGVNNVYFNEEYK